MKKSRGSEKEYRKKHLFSMDEDYEDDDEIEEDDDEAEEDEDEADEDDDDNEDEVDEEDEDEVDDEDDELEDDDDDEDDNWSSEDEKRARRRARRIRNQILSYTVVVILIAGAFGGLFLGGRKLVQNYQANKHEKEQQEQLDALLQEEDPVINIDDFTEDEIQSEETVLSPLDEIVMARISEMPLTDKVAALFMVTPEQLTGVTNVTRAGDTTREALGQYKVGGLVYTDSNITDENQLKELLSNTKNIDPTLFLAVNEEGGENSTVASKVSVAEVSDMASVGASGSTDGAYQAGSTTGAYLAEYGFTLNLAPVADVKISEDSILGNRCFGPDSGQTGEMAAAYVTGLTEQGVSACVKMFPGLGAVTESTADGMADTARSQSDMEGVEFPAYQTAINAGSEFVMVGTISAPALTGDNTPCCFSSAVIGLLRNNLGFDGVVITGALNEAAVTDYHTPAEAAEKALRAGADMIYMPENFKEAYDGLLQKAEADEALQSRIDEALLRIYRIKYKDKAEIDVGGMEEAPEPAEGEGEELPAE